MALSASNDAPVCCLPHFCCAHTVTVPLCKTLLKMPPSKDLNWDQASDSALCYCCLSLGPLPTPTTRPCLYSKGSIPSPWMYFSEVLCNPETSPLPPSSFPLSDPIFFLESAGCFKNRTCPGCVSHWAEGPLPVILDVSLTTCFSWLFSQPLKALLCSTLSAKEGKTLSVS